MILDRLGHRGPDDTGCLYVSRSDVKATRSPQDRAELDVAFLHRRLAIIDPSPAGWQPMTTPDGRFSLVYNGEIYNYLELREELEQQGCTEFRSNCDTEVLLRGYERWGVDVLPRLVGMFAFAILDTRARTILLARDFAGIKPLYHARWSGGWAFASEIKALLELPGVSRVAHPYLVYDYLRHGQTDHGSETMLKGVQQVPAGSFLLLDLSDLGARAKRFWTMSDGARFEGSLQEAATRMRQLFLESVRLHLRSDVPLGTALSGGIDSSSILCAIRYLEPEADLHAVSYLAEDPSLSEEKWVRIAATHARATIHPVSSSSDLLRDELQSLMNAQEFPFAGTSIYAQFCVFREARRAGLKVMLDGQGADEMLGGYRIYQAARLASLLRRGRIAEGAGYLSRLRRETGGEGLLHLSRAVGLLIPENVRDLQPSAWLLDGSHWLNGKWFRERGVPLTVHPWHSHAPFVLREVLRRSFLETSLPMLLRYEDRNSMAASVESRVPFLTPALVDFAFSLPEEYLIDSRGRTKAVFRQAMRGIVPDSILDRRDKIGFVTPQPAWLRQLDSWVNAIVTSEASIGLPVFSRGGLDRSLRRAQSRGRERDYRTIWRWLNFICWTEQHNVTFE